MKYRVIARTSIFPASREVVFNKLKKLETLQYIAAPLISFIPLDGEDGLIWEIGREFVFHLKLFGILPFGIHRIQVIEFNEISFNIYTRETSTYILVWNHRIILEETEEGHTCYTDEVELYAGWKMPFVLLWGKVFYRHRQKKWIKLLQAGKK